MSGRNRLATLVVTITTHIGVTGLASYHRYRRIGHVHWITSKHWTESVYSHSFGSREMSELWLSQCSGTAPLILAEGAGSAEWIFYLGLWLAYGYK